MTSGMTIDKELLEQYMTNPTVGVFSDKNGTRAAILFLSDQDYDNWSQKHKSIFSSEMKIPNCVPLFTSNSYYTVYRPKRKTLFAQYTFFVYEDVGLSRNNMNFTEFPKATYHDDLLEFFYNHQKGYKYELLKGMSSHHLSEIEKTENNLPDDCVLPTDQEYTTTILMEKVPMRILDRRPLSFVDVVNYSCTSNYINLIMDNERFRERAVFDDESYAIIVDTKISSYDESFFEYLQPTLLDFSHTNQPFLNNAKRVLIGCIGSVWYFFYTDSEDKLYPTGRVLGKVEEIKKWFLSDQLFDDHTAELFFIWFLIKYRLILSSEKTPLASEIESNQTKTDGVGKKQTNKRLDTRVIHLSTRYKNKVETEQEYRGALNTEHLHQEKRFVHGHIRLQRYGKGNSLVKKIFVEGYSKNYWIKDNLIFSSYVKK